VAALEEVNFTLNQAEVVAIIGESGSGKSTLLRIMAGLESPSSGQVHLNGELLEGPDTKLVPGHEALPLVHQHLDLLPKHSVYHNVAYALRHLAEEEQKNLTEDLLSRFHLNEATHRLPVQLSGGQQQRLAIARALARQPEVLLMDEPFSQLDTLLKTEILFELLRYQQEQGWSLVMVTHEAREALQYAHRLVVLRQGKIVQEGNPEDIWLRPASPYVASLTGIINPLDAGTLSEWGITHLHSAWVRAEHVTPSTNGKTHIITWVGFLGHQAAYRAERQGRPMMFYDAVGAWKPGQEVRLSISKADLLSFS
jgi:ABC-type sulfate/molybdate transport systems ATPase subunit